MTSIKVNINSLCISSEGFSALEKKPHNISPEGCDAHLEQNIWIVPSGKGFAGLFYTNCS
jgi:hypothetical protein